jgi:uncharacterized DUF497 family protein
MSIRFSWDPRKAESNWAKHGISFEEGITVFADPLARIFEDEEHSGSEKREIIVGHTDQQSLVVVVFAESDEFIRIISARRATRTERKDYEENVSP